METITLINGNKQAYTCELPKLFWLTKFVNDVALAHITENTGLVFVKTAWGYEAQPETSQQIAALFMTYNFKTRFYNNWQYKNTLVLKSDHHIGFDVDSICYECANYNGVHTHGMGKIDRLAC